MVVAVFTAASASTTARRALARPSRTPAPSTTTRRTPPVRRWEGGLPGRTRAFYVPSESFGGLSPERKAAQMMKTLFTMCAVKIVLAQLEGSSAGRGSTAFGSFNPKACETIYTHLEEVPLKDGDEWLRKLMKKDRLLALRIVEVREAYSREGFEWDSLKKAAIQEVEAANIKILREGAESMLGDV